jgi:NitT/TauT family transport system substrate-binding protein
VLLYSENFATKKTDAAGRFMRAYLRAVRFYNGALKDGHLAGPNADEVIAILSAATPIKDLGVYKAITPTGMNPDGAVNTKSLADDYAFYKGYGLIKQDVKLEDVVDNSFVAEAVKELGPYKK